MKAGIPGEEDSPVCPAHGPATPQRRVPVAEATGAEVSRWRCRDLQSAHGGCLPPVELPHVSDAIASEEDAATKRTEPARRGLVPREPFDRPPIEMIVVIVGLQDEIDRWKHLERDAGW